MKSNSTQKKIFRPGFSALQLISVLCSVLFSITDSSGQTTKNPDFKAPYCFTENKGQIVDQDYKSNAAVKYLLSYPGFNVQLRQTGFSYDTYSDENQSRHYHRVDVELLDCNSEVQIVPFDTSDFYFNYFTTGTPQGGVANVHNYGRVLYKNIYPHIDLEFFSSGNQTDQMKNPGIVKYNFIIHPGGNTNDIKLNYKGADDVNLVDGKIDVKVASGIFSENIPESFFEKDNQKVEMIYSSLGNNVFSFTMKNPVPVTSDLIIDPVPSLLWGTYYGGGVSDQAMGITLGTGNTVFSCGTTSSTNNIATAGAWQTTQGGLAGTDDVFVAKFNSTGTSLVWGTYYGGTADEIARDIVLDGSGNIYITGSTASSNNIATAGAWQTSFSGNNDVFIAKFNATGSSLLWGTYYGAAGYDDGFALVLDAGNNIYITGTTENTTGISTAGVWQISNGGLYDAFVAKFNSSGSALLWGTYYGGTSVDKGYDIALDASNNVYVTGYTVSPNAIASGGAWQSAFAGNEDAFVAKFNATGSRLWGTYYGGAGLDEGNNIALDASNNIYISGTTYSTTAIATAGAYQTVWGGGLYDAFVAKFNSSGSSLIWGTYYGGTGREEALGLFIDAANNIYISGRTTSTSAIATAGAWQTVFAGGAFDAFLAMFSPSGSSLVWGTYYGGTGADHGEKIIVDGAGNIFLTGYTLSSSAIATPGAWRTASAGNFDAFVAEFSNPAVLPVEWLYFTGEAEAGYNKLNWGTATETNNNFFTLFRSTDGLTFSEMGRMDGAGTSSMQHDYSFNDMNPAEGINYYRLMQTDFNGQFKYSQIIALEFHSTGMSVGNSYPNPTTGDLLFDFVSTVNTQIHFIITDMAGKNIADENEEVNPGHNTIHASLSGEAEGTYILHITETGSGFDSVSRIVKY